MLNHIDKALSSFHSAKSEMRETLYSCEGDFIFQACLLVRIQIYMRAIMCEKLKISLFAHIFSLQ